MASYIIAYEEARGRAQNSLPIGLHAFWQQSIYASFLSNDIEMPKDIISTDDWRIAKAEQGSEQLPIHGVINLLSPITVRVSECI